MISPRAFIDLFSIFRLAFSEFSPVSPRSFYGLSAIFLDLSVIFLRSSLIFLQSSGDRFSIIHQFFRELFSVFLDFHQVFLGFFAIFFGLRSVPQQSFFRLSTVSSHTFCDHFAIFFRSFYNLPSFTRHFQRVFLMLFTIFFRPFAGLFQKNFSQFLLCISTNFLQSFAGIFKIFQRISSLTFHNLFTIVSQYFPDLLVIFPWSSLGLGTANCSSVSPVFSQSFDRFFSRSFPGLSVTFFRSFTVF
jgi:hypothetical protein